MKHLIVLLLATIQCSIAMAKNEVDTSYAASMIPAALKENAHVVVRNEHVQVDVLSLNKVKYRKTYAITIFDSKGEDYAALECQYNLLQKINDISGILYDEHGKVIKKMNERDALDVSTYGSSSVFHSDSRIKKFNFDYYKYPFTVEYTIESTLSTTFFLPSWHAQPDIDMGIENTTFNITYPENIPIRHKEYLMPHDVTTSKTTGTDHLITESWNISNLTPRYEQPFSKSDNYSGPTVVLNADKFVLLEHEGNMNSWKDLGMFIYKLNEGLDVLPEDTKANVKTITANATSNYDKVQLLYKYMQESTRYVAIEYGISGWQTFDALNVAKTGYGDCKGLTNYLKALLKEAGIKSYATLVFAGSDDYFKLDESFPSNVFNHVILCVPDNKDTIWVECTSQRLKAGYLGDFTQDRKVLLITENGGIISKTPAYDLNKSFIVRKALLDLKPDLTSQQISLNNHYSGLMQDDLSSIIKTESDDKLKEMVNKKFPFPSYSVTSFKYQEVGTQSLPEMKELAEVSVSGIITKTQKRTFLNIGWMNNPMSSASQSKPRMAPLVLNESFKITDTVIINLPEGLEIEAMPDAVTLSYAFGSYSTKFEHNKNQIIFVRQYLQNKGIFKVEDYEKYLKMYNNINADKNNLTLVFLNKAS